MLHIDGGSDRNNFKASSSSRTTAVLHGLHRPKRRDLVEYGKAARPYNIEVEMYSDSLLRVWTRMGGRMKHER